MKDEYGDFGMGGLIMKFYYNGYSCMGWLPEHDGGRAGYYRFATVEEYKEAYVEMARGCQCQDIINAM